MANTGNSSVPSPVPLWKIVAVSLGAIAWVGILNAYRWAIPSQFGFTPDGVCANAEVLENFLSKGGDPNTRIQVSRSPTRLSLLECAVVRGRKDLMQILIDRGADLEQRSAMPNPLNRGGTALHWAILGKDPAAAILLLEAGADVNARFDYLLGCAFCSGTHDITPLHLAASTGQLAMIDLLLNFGAETSAQDGDGDTPLQVASQFRHQEAIAFFEAKGIRE